MTCPVILHAADGDHACILEAAHLTDSDSLTHRDVNGVEWSCAFDAPPTAP